MDISALVLVSALVATVVQDEEGPRERTVRRVNVLWGGSGQCIKLRDWSCGVVGGDTREIIESES